MLLVLAAVGVLLPSQAKADPWKSRSLRTYADVLEISSHCTIQSSRSWNFRAHVHGYYTPSFVLLALNPGCWLSDSGSFKLQFPWSFKT
jgi:hypothetical protein